MLQITLDDVFDLYVSSVEEISTLLLGDNDTAVVITVSAFTEIREGAIVFDSEENVRSYWMISVKQKCLGYINRIQNGGSMQ